MKNLVSENKKTRLIVIGIFMVLTSTILIFKSNDSRDYYLEELKKVEIYGTIKDSVKRQRPLQRILVKNENDSVKEYFINLMIPYLLKDDSVSKIANSDSMNFYRKENGEYKLIYTFKVEPL
jgi:hypothetical protein